MITLNISTSINHNINELLEFFKLSDIECQITTTSSILKKNKKCIIETGYIIKFFVIDKNDFKELVWKPLQQLLDLKCAFILVENEYMGCIKNCPNVFTKSHCDSTC